jgi:hypothetical protein
MAKIVVRIPEPKAEYDASTQKQINRAIQSIVDQLNSTFLQELNEKSDRYNKKEYDSDKLSDNGKLILARLQSIKAKKDQLTIDFSELNVIEKNYLDLLKKELPKEEEKADVK